MEKQLIYSDVKYQKLTAVEIKTAQTSLQKLLDAWNTLNLPPATDLFQLVFSTEKVHSDAVKSVVKVPVMEGTYQLDKDVYVRMLGIPYPNELHLLAVDCKRITWVGRKELWSVSDDGETVMLNEEIAEEFIHAQDVYLENERQRIFADAVVAYEKASNDIYEMVTTNAGMGLQYSTPFIILERGANMLNKVEIQPDQFRGMLIQLK